MPSLLKLLGINSDNSAAFVDPVEAGRNLPALLAQSAADSLLRNARVRPLHPSPPTITVGTSTAPAGHTRVYTFGNAGAPFASSGGRPTTAAGRTTFPVVTPSSTRIDFCWSVETIVDGDSVAFLLDSVTADGYRFVVDGQYVSLTSTTSAAGSERYYRLEWPTRAKRRVIVEGNTGLGFRGAATPDSGMCIMPADAEGPRLFYVGDSDPFHHGFNQKGDSYGFVLGACLGIRDTWVNAISGTGFLASAANPYSARRADWTTLPADSVHLLIFQMSYNDAAGGGYSAAAIKAAVALELAEARAAHPNAVIIVHGASSWNETGGIGAVFIAQENAAAEAVAEAADPLIGFIPIYSASYEKPIQGVSASGDTGTGNTPFYVNHAIDHMNAAGNLHHGRWLAYRVLEKLAELGGIEVPAIAPADVGSTGGGGGVSNLTVSSTAPSSPSPGDAWLDTTPLSPADFWVYQRFAQNVATVATPLFTGVAISTGTSNTVVPAAAVLGWNPEGVFIRSSTTANGGYRYITTSAAGHFFGQGVGHKFRGQYMPITSLTGRMVRIGYLDTATNADSTDGAYFELDEGTCRAKTANNSTRTTHGTTVAISVGVHYTFDIDVNAAGTSARFRVYAGLSATPVLDVTITDNIPTTYARGFQAGFVATESSTTASDIGVLFGMGFGTPRAFERVMGPA